MLIDKKSNWNFVEVKYRNEIKHDDLKFLRKYLLENNLNKAFVVTKKRFELIKSPEFELCLIPAMLL
jgi:septin family protein